MKVNEIFIEESKVNKHRFILVIVTEDDKRYVASGDHWNPTYLTTYDESFDTKPLEKHKPIKQ